MDFFCFFSRIILFFLFSAGILHAYFGRNEAGQEVFSFSSTFHSPRNAALEFSSAAKPSIDLGITLLNPAALRLPGNKNNAAAIFFHTGDFAENQGVVSYARRLQTLTIQASYGWLSYGEIEGYDEWGNETGKTYSPISQLFSLSASIPLRLIHVGMSVRFLTDKLADELGDRVALGLSTAWGISWVSSSNRLGISISARDFGTMIRDYVDDGEDSHYAMAETFALSAFFRFKKIPKLSLFGETTFPRYSECALRLGAEYALSQNFFLRGGFSRTWIDLTRDFKELIGAGTRPGESNESRLFSLGMGYAIKFLLIDYAFSYLTQGLGFEHRIGLQIEF